MSGNKAGTYTDGVSEYYLGPEEFSNELGVIHALMPYKHFSRNPWDELEYIQSYLKSLPTHTATWVYREIPEIDVYDIDPTRLNLLTRLVGSWAMDTVNNNKTKRFVNPYYHSLEELDWTPIQDKYDHYVEIGKLGKFTCDDLAGRYNVSREAVTRMFQRRGEHWSEHRLRGQQRLANTVYATREWGGVSVRACAQKLNMPEQTLRDWVKRYRTLDELPPNPSENRRGRDWER